MRPYYLKIKESKNMKKTYKTPSIIIMGSMVKITQGGPSPTATEDANSSGYDASHSK